jgi:uncharacterized glyoxalase superfamily protein PhnB
MTGTTQNVFPTIRFKDADAAIDWLGRAFGFGEHSVYRNDAGVVEHAELSLEGGIVMLGQGEPGAGGIYIALDDIDAHFKQAKAAGAEITRELADTSYGSREYGARDPEGHDWYFGNYRPNGTS